MYGTTPRTTPHLRPATATAGTAQGATADNVNDHVCLLRLAQQRREHMNGQNDVRRNANIGVFGISAQSGADSRTRRKGRIDGLAPKLIYRNGTRI